MEFLSYCNEAFESGKIPLHKPLSTEPWEQGTYWHGVAGQPICSNSDGEPAYFASISALQGDGKEKVKQNGFERNYNANFICEQCLGCRHLRFCNAFDFNPYADWLRSITTCEQYLSTHDVDNRSPYSTMPFWGLSRWFWDLLHLLWLGVAKDLLGTEILLMAQDLAHLSISEALLVLERNFNDHQRMHRKTGQFQANHAVIIMVVSRLHRIGARSKDCRTTDCNMGR